MITALTMLESLDAHDCGGLRRTVVDIFHMACEKTRIPSELRRLPEKAPIKYHSPKTLRDEPENPVLGATKCDVSIQILGVNYYSPPPFFAVTYGVPSRGSLCP